LFQTKGRGRTLNQPKERSTVPNIKRNKPKGGSHHSLNQKIRSKRVASQKLSKRINPRRSYPNQIEKRRKPQKISDQEKYLRKNHD
jgi:hypothetical protein